MTPAAAREAAMLLWSCWQSGRRVPGLPEACRPVTRSEGYVVQSAVLEVSGRRGLGWKIAATSVAGQAHIGVDGPLAGRLLSGQVADSGVEVSLRGTQMHVAEPEFAFRLAIDLPQRARPYTEDQVLAGVASMHPAIEIPDSRYDDFARVGAAQLIADNACAHFFVLGAATSFDWRRLDLAVHPVEAEVLGRFQRAGKGANVLGGPAIALTWLANELASIGPGLRAGDLITTGTCMAPLEVMPGDRVTVDFGELGRVQAGLAD
jgi:2-keto-4-pentenoate hydratase